MLFEGYFCCFIHLFIFFTEHSRALSPPASDDSQVKRRVKEVRINCACSVNMFYFIYNLHTNIKQSMVIFFLNLYYFFHIIFMLMYHKQVKIDSFPGKHYMY